MCPIQHLVVCDACGISSEDTSWNPNGDFWEPPGQWIWLEDGHADSLGAKYFCSYVCMGAYVTQKIREEDIPRIGPGPQHD